MFWPTAHCGTGNHDYWPVSRWEMPPVCSWLLRNVSQWWASWLPGDAMTSFLQGGYYSVRPPSPSAWHGPSR